MGFVDKLRKTSVAARGDEGYLTRGHLVSLGLLQSISEAVLLKLSGERGHALVVHGFLASISLLDFQRVEFGSLILALLFKSLNEALLGPAALSSEISEGTELAVSLQSEDLECFGDNDTLLVVVGEGNSLEDL